MSKKFLITIPVIFFLIFLQVISVMSLPYTLTDSINDVNHYQNTTFVTQGDFHDEIDIVNFEIDTNKLTMTLDDTPVFSVERLYLMSVYWDGDSDSLNYTFAQFGGGFNQILTYLWDSQENPVAINVVPGLITIVGNSLETPIPAFDLILNPSEPQFIEVYAAYIIDSANYYNDNSTGGELVLPSASSPGFEICLVISGLSILIIIRIYQRRKE